MKIIIIEDEEYKQEDLREWLKNWNASAHLTIAESFRGAREILGRETFDICVLDMNLPTFDKHAWNGTPDSSALAGRRLINFIEKTKVVKRVILFTQYSSFSEYTEEFSYSALVDLVKEDCPEVFAGAVQYIVGDESWKSDFENIIKRITNENITN